MSNILIKKRTSQKGFTVVELVIVIAIMLGLIAVLIFNYPQAKSQYALSRAAYKFGQDLRRVQDLSLSAFQYKDATGVSHDVYGYGINLDIATNNRKYILYADAQAPQQGANGHYDLADYIIDTVDLSDTEPNVYIAMVHNVTGNNTSINFKAPNTATTISNLVSDQTTIKVTFGLLNDDTKTRAVSIGTSGFIDIAPLGGFLNPYPTPPPVSPDPTPTPPPTPSPESLDFPGWTSPSPDPSPSPAPDSTLIAYWPFDETAEPMSGIVADVTGHGHDGTTSGAAGANDHPQSSSSVPSAITFSNPRSLNFDGTDDKVSLSAGIPTGNTFTLVFWIKPNLQTEAYGDIFSDANSNYGLWYLGSDFGSDNGKFRFFWSGGSQTTTTSLPINIPWSQVALVVNGGAGTFYINGTQSGTFNAGTDNGGAGFTGIHMGTDSLNEAFKGSLDDMRLYNRALSSSEIINLPSGASDTTPPVISSVAASVSTLPPQAQITWITNEAADSQVEYGTTTSYGSSTTLTTSLVLSHNQTVPTNFPSNTLYHYRVKSRDAAGNLATSADFTFDPNVSSSNPIAYWKLDEGSGTSATDSSGHGNTGTLNNGATYSGVVPTVNFSDPYSVSFNGIADTVTSDSNIGLSGDVTVTISAWVNLADTTTQGAIVSLGYPFTSLAAVALYENATSGSISAEFAGANEAISTITLSPNTWYHVALVKTPGAINSTTKIYVNGVDGGLVGGASSSTPNVTNLPLVVAGFNSINGAGYNFKGKVDDVRIYDRALSASEISTLAGFDSTLIAYWKFDEAITEPMSLVVADATGNGHDGTTSGAAGANDRPQPSSSVPSAITFPNPRSLNFDGTDDKVSLSAGIATGTTFSLAFWIKPNGQNLDYGNIISDSSASYGLWYRGASAGSNARKLHLWTPSVENNKLNNTPLTDGQWSHFAVVVDEGSGTFYVNGSADGTFTITSGFTGINMGNDVLNEAFKGSLDDMRLYDRALSSSEISDLASGGP